MDSSQPNDELLYNLGLALLELNGSKIAIELEHPPNPAALVLHGTLLRAFDSPCSTKNPTMTLMIGAASITIRTTTIKQAQYQYTKPNQKTLKAIRLSLNDSYVLHIQTT